MALDPEAKRLRKLSPAELADEAGALKAKTERVKDEAIRRGLRKAEGQAWKLSLSPPGTSQRTDRARLLEVMGISESDFELRFCNRVETDWSMRVTAKRVPRTPEQPVIARAKAAA